MSESHLVRRLPTLKAPGRRDEQRARQQIGVGSLGSGWARHREPLPVFEKRSMSLPRERID
jgi:hypothetical protein